MKNNSIHLILIIIILASPDILSNNYIAYISVCILFLIRIKTFTLKCGISIVYAFYAIICFSFFKFFQLTSDSIKDILLMLLGFICFCNRDTLKINIKKLNIALAICFALCFVMRAQDFSLSLSNLIASDTGYESALFPFIFAFFFYYWLGKSKTFSVVNFIISMIAGKRIVMLGVLIILTYHFCLKYKILNRFLSSNMFLYSLNVLSVLIFFLFFLGAFNDFIFDTFGVSANALTMGRQSLYEAAFTSNRYDMNSILFMGIGVGNVVRFIDYDGFLLHNDLLKLIIENGIPITILFFFLLYHKVDREAKGFVILWNIFLLTDNTLIYPSVVFALLFFMHYFSKQKEMKAHLTYYEKE